MEFRILGPVEVIVDGRGLALGGTKQRALLALLILHAGETLSRDRLIDELWGERPPTSAAKAIQVYVSRLRKALGPAGRVVVTRDAGYALAVEREAIDADRFERAVAEVPEDPLRAEAAMEEALALWRGPPLADLAHEPFAQIHAARLEDLRLAALELLLEAKLARGSYDEVIRRLEAPIEEHPYRERFRAQLMLALYRSDRQADALAAYRDARRTLVEDLGIEPGQRLRELERAILAQDLSLLSEPREAEPARDMLSIPRPLRLPAGAEFVGRARELTRLRELWEDAGRSPRIAAALSGEPGIGKTRLAAELAAGVRGPVLYGRCDEGLAAPYQPFADALRPLATSIGPERLRPELAALFPTLDGLEKRATEQLALFEAVVALLELATRDRRVLLVLDDLHWATPPTLLLARYVLHCDRPLKLFVVMTYRDTETGDALERLVADPSVEAIPVRGLDEPDIAALLALHGREAALAGRLRAETNGNPFFVRELVEDDRLTASDTVRAVIAQRVARLSAAAQRVLAVAAVAGQEFAVGVVEHVVGNEVDLLDALDEAASARLVVEAGHGDYAFAHALVRQTIYDGLGAARRARLHRRVGEALEALGRDDPEALAHHFAEAATDGQAAKAADYALAAGRDAVKRVGHEEAAAHYRRGLHALDQGGRPDRRRRGELELALERTRYQPLPELGALPRWVWRRLPVAGKAAVALTPVAVVALVLAFGPGIESSRRENAARDAQQRRESSAAYIARVNAEQRPRIGRGVAAGADRAARARLVGAVERSVAADARARVARRALAGPILRTECEPHPRGAVDAGARFGNYACLAVVADVPATSISPAGARGHGYRARIDFETGRYAYCKAAAATGKSLRAIQPFIRLPRACGGG